MLNYHKFVLGCVLFLMFCIFNWILKHISRLVLRSAVTSVRVEIKRSFRSAANWTGHPFSPRRKQQDSRRKDLLSGCHPKVQVHPRINPSAVICNSLSVSSKLFLLGISSYYQVLLASLDISSRYLWLYFPPDSAPHSSAVVVSNYG